MRIALVATDRPDALDVRMDNRSKHLAYIEETGCVEMAGPLIDANGQMCGSLVVLDVEDMNAAEHWAENDPYKIAGLFESVQLTEWKKVVG